MKEAMDRGFGSGKSFVYAITDSQRQARYVGMASNGFQNRYRGGTHNAIDAAMDSSDNLILLAEVEKAILRDVEKELIFSWRQSLRWNKQKVAPKVRLRIEHQGIFPTNPHETSALKQTRMKSKQKYHPD